MLEDDYTGSLADDGFDDPFEPLDDDLVDWDEEGDVDFDDDFDVLNETTVNVIDAVEGAKSLQDAAERLYVFADELLSLNALGWELMDDIVNGQGVALMVGEEEYDMDDAEGL